MLRNKKKKQLKDKIGNGRRQRKHHKRRSEILQSVAAESEGNAAKLGPFITEKSSRPPLEDTYPDLHQAIVPLATATAGADGKRADMIHAYHTSHGLRAALLKEGYILSRNALYLRLAPRRSNSNEGKKTCENCSS